MHRTLLASAPTASPASVANNQTPPARLSAAAVAAYCQLAADWGLSGANLALRFVLGHPLVASAVVGATNGKQLGELLAAAAAPPLEEALVEAVDAIHRRYPNPTP